MDTLRPEIAAMLAAPTPSSPASLASPPSPLAPVLPAVLPAPSGAMLPLLLLAAPALFAANMVAARWAQQADIPPLFLAWGRWVLAVLLLLPWSGRRLWALRGTLGEAAPRLALLSALGMGLAVAPQYLGARTTTATNVALIFAASPVLVILLDTLLWKAPLRPRVLAGLAMALAGVVVILTRGEAHALVGLAFGSGDLWVVLAAAGWALYTLLSRRRPLPPLPGDVRMLALMLGGVLALSPFALGESLAGHRPDFGDPAVYTALGFLALVPSLGAYFLYDRLIALAGAGGASSSMYLVPVYAALLAWPLLGEAPHSFHLAGLALILPGVALARGGEGGVPLFGFILLPWERRRA